MDDEGWKEVTVILRYRESVLVPDGQDSTEPRTVEDLIDSLDQFGNNVFGGQIELAIKKVIKKRAKLPVKDYLGREWESQGKMDCAFGGCRGCSKCW